MRTHISKSLQVRCKTLRKAVEDHNKAAAALDPPRPTLDWSKISTYQFLEQIILLRDTRNDLRDKRWANPGVRETIKLINRISRAREELEDLNLEVRRVHTAIDDDDALFTKTIASLDPTNPIRGALADFATRRRRIDQQVLARIHQVYALPGYTGIRGPGVRLGGNAKPIPLLCAGAIAPTENLPRGLELLADVGTSLPTGSQSHNVQLPSEGGLFQSRLFTVLSAYLSGCRYFT